MNIDNLFINLLNILYNLFYLDNKEYIQKQVSFNVNEDDYKKTDEEEINDILKYLLKNKLEYQFKTQNQIFFNIKISTDKKIFFVINLNDTDSIIFNRKVRYIFNSNLNLNNFLLGIMNFDIDIDNKY